MYKRENSDDDCENHSSSSIGLNIGSLSSKKLSKRMSFTPEYVSPTPNSTKYNRMKTIQFNNFNFQNHSSFHHMKQPIKTSNSFNTVSYSSALINKDLTTYVDNNDDSPALSLPLIENFESYTNVQVISDFYDYTEECIKKILELKQDKIVKSSVGYNFNLPAEDKNKKIAIFDLDETLIHCTGKDISNPQYIIDVTLPSKITMKIGINTRPNWKEAIEMIQKQYIIAVFTASYQSYADAVLDFIDPEKKYFKYRLYRHHCSRVNINSTPCYIKDLSIINDVDLSQLIIIDNSVFSFAFHLDNGILVIPYYDSPQDNELILLAHYLCAIVNEEDVRDANRQNINMNFYVEKAKKALESSDDSSENESELSTKRTAPETPTIAKLKKRPSITIKRNGKKRKVYLIGKELTNQIEKIREKIRNKENKKIYISN